tara:strand:- start:223 stop:474 length:252 start_codon:yes stop_codon:yes gene_type:complete
MGIKINMEKARDIWRNKIRFKRASKFAPLDAAWYKATEVGEDTSDIVAKKQALRDFPSRPEIEAAETIEELREIWDSDLLGDK